MYAILFVGFAVSCSIAAVLEWPEKWPEDLVAGIAAGGLVGGGLAVIGDSIGKVGISLGSAIENRMNATYFVQFSGVNIPSYTIKLGAAVVGAC